MKNSPIILLTWIPWTWKSTISNKIANKLWDSYSIVTTHELRDNLIKWNDKFNNTWATIITDEIWRIIKNLQPNKWLIIDWVWKTPDRRIEIWEHTIKNSRDILIIQTIAETNNILERIRNRDTKWEWIQPTNDENIVKNYIKTYVPPSEIEYNKGKSWLVFINTSDWQLEVIYMCNWLNNFYKSKILPILE